MTLVETTPIYEEILLFVSVLTFSNICPVFFFLILSNSLSYQFPNSLQFIVKYFVSKVPFLFSTLAFLVLPIRESGLNSHLFREKRTVSYVFLILALPSSLPSIVLCSPPDLCPLPSSGCCLTDFLTTLSSSICLLPLFSFLLFFPESFHRENPRSFSDHRNTYW